MEAWKIQVLKRNQEAQAYVNTAIRKFKLTQTQSSVSKWFGQRATVDVHYLNEVNRVLNSVAEMLVSVEYVYPGAECSWNSYAYVYPYGPASRTPDGKYVLNLCKLYMGSTQAVQIETLTHEGSHHATAYTDDVCADELYGGTAAQYNEMPRNLFPAEVEVGQYYNIEGNTAIVRLLKPDTVVLEILGGDCARRAYGRDACMMIALRDTVKALRNADNVCYYIQEVAESP